MTQSLTRSASFTITDARQVGARVGADLRMLNSLYGRPAEDRVPDYVEEVALLLKDGYLGTVDYGFRDRNTNSWKLRLRYTAASGGLLRNDRPGSYPRGAAVAGADFYSYLTYTPAFDALSAADRAAVKNALPITRADAAAPAAITGTTTSGHGYSRNGIGVERTVYVAHEEGYL